jgi:hypothetical protein
VSVLVSFEFGTGFRFSREAWGVALPSWRESLVIPALVLAEDEATVAGLRQTENFSVLWLNEERTLT